MNIKKRANGECLKMNNKKCMIIYHNDLDGQCSAVIANRMLSNYYKIYYVKADYNKEIKMPKDWANFQKVGIFDFSLEDVLLDEIIKNIGRNNVTWIDHHVSKIKMYEKYENISGFRITDGFAACELTWKYYFNMIKMPDFVKFIADQDIWRFKYGKNTKYFCEYMESKNTDPENKIWKDLFKSNNYYSFFKEGKLLRENKLFRLNNVIKKSAYISRIDGIECIRINYNGEDRSEIANIMLDKYENINIAWVYCYTRKNNKVIRTNSLRSNGKIDTSIISTKRGGGGHKNASGWVDKINKK